MVPQRSHRWNWQGAGGSLVMLSGSLGLCVMFYFFSIKETLERALKLTFAVQISFQ